MSVTIGLKAPNLKVSKWYQGLPTNIDQENDKIVLVEVFQVNCPGCFLYGIPEAVDIYNRYKDQGVTVLGVATAFEDYDKNTPENLEKLLTTGEVIGETLNALGQYGKLKEGNKIPYKIPFPVAMDLLKKNTGDITQEKIDEVIKANIPNFDSYDKTQQDEINEKVKQYLKTKEYSAETFETYALRGTPSSILVDRKGVLRDVSFGQTGVVESKIQQLLNE